MSYSQLRDDGVAVYPVSTSGASERLAFLQKVYSLTFLGVLFFAMSIALPVLGAMYEIPVLASIAQLSITINPWIAVGVMIGSSFLVHWVSMIRGVNLVAFFAFSFMWGFLTIPLVLFALGSMGVMVIIQAAFLTTFVFGGLTAYVLISRRDFGFMGAALTIGSFIALGAIIVALVASTFFGADVEWMSLGMSVFFVILFSGYVLYDTSEIMHRYASDMVVPAALALMVDFIILFRSLLRILMAARS